MKPDGVTTAALEPMETLESNPMNEAAPAAGQEPNQAASPAEGEEPQQPAAETGQVEPQPDKAKDTPAAKTSSKTAGDPKAKTANKTTPKAKPGTNNPAKTTPGSRTSTPQSRLSNGVSKPQTNGVAKKAPPAAVKKTTPTPAPLKKPTSTTTAPAPKSKVGEKKATGAAPATNGAKPVTGTTTAAAKRTPSTTANGVKTGSTPAAAKKPPAPKLASAAPGKPGSSASPKPAVTKTTRPAPGSSASPRPATGSSRPPTTSTTKSSVSATSKPAAPKTTAAKPAASKPTSTAPPGGKPPASLTSRTTTPVKKDVTKSATSTAKKPADSPLSRPSPASKSAKPDAPKSASKSDAAAKKPTGTPSRPKTQDSKPTPSKTPASKPKTSSPKKAVGSSTPTPVKRGPKAVAAEPGKEAAAAEPGKEAAAAEPGKEAAAAVAAAAAIATAAAVIASPEEPEPHAEVPLKPSAGEAPELMSSQTEEKTAEPITAPESETIQPEPIQEPAAIREPTPEPVRELSPLEDLSQLSEAKLLPEQASDIQLPVQMDFKFEESVNSSVQSLGTTVMSPPCSPPGPVSPAREPQSASSLLDMHVQSDPWDKSPSHAAADFAPQSLVNMMDFQTEERQESSEEEEEEKEEVLLMPSSSAPPPAEPFSMAAQPQSLSAPLRVDFSSGDLMSPHEREEAVEKADEEINEDDEDEEEDEDEEQRRLGHLPSSMITEMSTSQPSEEFQVRSSAFGGSAGWHGDDLLSGMDSEDVSSCTSSRQHEISELSSTQHTALLEGTQSSDALVDSSLRGSEGDGNLMGSPNVETLANEEEEDEDEEDERVDDMDLSSERVEEQQKVFQQKDEEEEEEDEDVEMHSEGVMESCGIVDEDDFNEEERLDNLNRSGAAPCVPPAAASSSWDQTNPFSGSWTQPASLLSVSSPSPISDHGAAESETPTLSPAQTRLDSGSPSFAPRDEAKSSEQDEDLFAAPAVDLSQPGALSAGAPAAHSGSETSTPEDLRDYDSSSGVESRSDKQQTPVPASVQPDMEQDLGIHLEKGDGEEEEAETLPADEVLGTGPPTAPASAPSSPSTSGDEASDTEGEMQINDPDAPAMMDESAGFESPPPARSLPALDEDEESADTAVAEGEEDGGGATPQSANSVASYGFDCTTSNSNAHSMAESCGKSPGIFSLENEEQLPEEAKDPSLIKELTLPSAAAAAQADDLLDRPVDLMPLGHAPSLDEHHYMFGGKVAVDHLEEVDPLEPSRHLGADDSGDPSDSQPPYYSTICDKTDSFLAGNV